MAKGKRPIVGSGRVPWNFQELRGFSEEMRRRGLVPSAKVLALELEEPDPETAQALELAADEKTYCLRRLRFVNEEAGGRRYQPSAGSPLFAESRSKISPGNPFTISSRMSTGASSIGPKKSSVRSPPAKRKRVSCRHLPGVLSSRSRKQPTMCSGPRLNTAPRSCGLTAILPPSYQSARRSGSARSQASKTANPQKSSGPPKGLKSGLNSDLSDAVAAPLSA